MSKVIRLSLDTEFNEGINLGHFSAVDLISVGLVNVDRVIPFKELSCKGFYQVSSEFNVCAAERDDWLRKNVMDRLFIDPFQEQSKATNQEIRKLLEKYLEEEVKSNPEAEKAEFWAKNGSYDNFLLCRLFDGMMNLYQFMNGLGIRKTNFRDLDELTFHKKTSTPRPQADAGKQHNSGYDAWFQAEVIRWHEGESTITSRMKTEIKTPQDAIKAGFVHN